MVDEPIDPRRIGSACEQLHLVIGKPGAKELKGDEGFRGGPAPIAHVGGRGRQLQEVETPSSKKTLRLRHIGKRIGVEIIPIPAMGLKPELKTASVGPLREARNKLFLEEFLSDTFVVFPNTFRPPRLKRNIDRAAALTEEVDHLCVLGFSPTSEEKREMGRHVITGLLLERLAEVRRERKLSHQLEAVHENPPHSTLRKGIQRGGSVVFEQGIGAPG